jgi:hypothetical protein
MTLWIASTSAVVGEPVAGIVVAGEATVAGEDTGDGTVVAVLAGVLLGVAWLDAGVLLGVAWLVTAAPAALVAVGVLLEPFPHAASATMRSNPATSARAAFFVTLARVRRGALPREEASIG